MNRTNRPKWSLKTQFGAALFVAVIASVCVIMLVKKDIWAELEIIASVLSVISFMYFFYLFYHGIRFAKEETYSITWKSFKLDGSWTDTIGVVDTGGAFASAAAEAGPLGWLVGLLLDIIVSIFLAVIIAFILWLGMNIVITGVIVLFLPLYFLFRRSLRVAVAKGRTCRGAFGKSLQYAFFVTLTNMFWLYLIIFTGYYISKWLNNS